MPKIKHLSAHEAQKIAAGEVIERPANIVKELIENAVDAGAQEIALHLEDGGKKLIRVVDTGCGMDQDDAQACFGKHATSKISFMDELEAVQTFGFRGEALASIAAVGRVTLITKEAQSAHGICVEMLNGKQIKCEPIGASTGTDISVHDLFDALPARKKFLKTAHTEWRHIHQLFQAFCFDYPTIHFKLFSENKQIFNCPAVSTALERATQLFEHDVAQHMLTIEATRIAPAITIRGVISNHQVTRYDRNHLFFFVNKRWVKNHKLASALFKGYAHVLPPGKYPCAAIHITVDPLTVDVNIHPRKEEVKFLHPHMVELLVREAVKKQLEDNLSAKVAPMQPKERPLFSAYSAAPAQESVLHPHKPSGNFTPFNFGQFLKDNQPPIAPRIETPVQSNFSAPSPSVTEKQVPAIAQEEYTVIGIFAQTYILLEHADGLFMLDQHAAHERVLYEEFATRFESLPTVPLLFPQMMTINAQDKEYIEPHLALLQKNGIAAELFGQDQLIIQSTPIHLKHAKIEDIVREVIAWVKELAGNAPDELLRTLNKKLHAQMACKAAVKAGDVLTQEQVTKLIRDWSTCDNRLTCPHGRPTGWLLTTYEIEKKFKRKV